MIDQVGIRNRLGGFATKDVIILVEENMVATYTNVSKNQTSAKGGETDEQGVLWCWMSITRS